MARFFFSPTALLCLYFRMFTNCGKISMGVHFILPKCLSVCSKPAFKVYIHAVINANGIKKKKSKKETNTNTNIYHFILVMLRSSFSLDMILNGPISTFFCGQKLRSFHSEQSAPLPGTSEH